MKDDSLITPSLLYFRPSLVFLGSPVTPLSSYIYIISHLGQRVKSFLHFISFSFIFLRGFLEVLRGTSLTHQTQHTYYTNTKRKCQVFSSLFFVVQGLHGGLGMQETYQEFGTVLAFLWGPLRFLGKFQGTFGKNVVELQIKSTMAYGIFEYLYIIYANSL